MANTTYIKVLRAIESFSREHLQIKKFASDFPEQMPNFATTTEEYPILFVSPGDGVFDVNINTFELTIYCFDIIQKDRANINTILSDTHSILNDLKIWLREGEIAGIDVNGTPRVTPINNALLDYVAGWEMSIVLDVDTYGLCEIPFDEAPAVLDVVNNIIYSKYLTCETLEDCSTFSDAIDGLQSQINNSIQEAPIDGEQYARQDGDWSVINIPTGSTPTSYVIGWEKEKQKSNLITLGKGKGKIRFTNGSNVILGLDGVDFNSGNNFDNPFYWYEITVLLADNTFRYILLNSNSSSIDGTIYRIYNNNDLVTNLGSSWLDATGDYEWWPYVLPSGTGRFAHAEGYKTKANGQGSHAEGRGTLTLGNYSHAEGDRTQATADATHAEGLLSVANDTGSHAEGESTIANGRGSHTEGRFTTANGRGSHAEGESNIANGASSHAGGYENIANNFSETVIGQYSIGITGSDTTFVDTDTIFRVGIGLDIDNKKDGFRVYKNGALYLYPQTTANITNGVNGFLMYNDTSKRLSTHNGTTWKEYAYTSDVTTSDIWKKSGLTVSATNSTDNVYRLGSANIVGSNKFFSTGPSQADIDGEILGNNFGHITSGSGTIPFIQLLSNSGNGSAGTNHFIGRFVGAGVGNPQMNFSAIKSTSYDAWGDSGRVLFRFNDGYLTPQTKFDIGTDYIKFNSYPSSRNDAGSASNILCTTSTGVLQSKSISSIIPTQKQYVRGYYPAWSDYTGGIWVTWPNNTSNMLSSGPSWSQGTASVPAWDSFNYIAVVGATRLSRFTYASSNSYISKTYEIIVQSFLLVDDVTAPGYLDQNLQTLIHQTFTTAPSGSIDLKDFTIANHTLDSNTAIRIAVRYISGLAYQQLGIQLLMEFE